MEEDLVSFASVMALIVRDLVKIWVKFSRVSSDCTNGTKKFKKIKKQKLTGAAAFHTQHSSMIYVECAWLSWRFASTDPCDTTILLLHIANTSMTGKFIFPTEAENRFIVADLVNVTWDVVAPLISIYESCGSINRKLKGEISTQNSL